MKGEGGSKGGEQGKKHAVRTVVGNSLGSPTQPKRLLNHNAIISKYDSSGSSEMLLQSQTTHPKHLLKVAAIFSLR